MGKSGKPRTRTTLNPELIRGLRARGRVAADKGQAKYKFAAKGKKSGAQRKAPSTQRKDKMDGRYYAADDVKVPLKSHHSKRPRTAKLRRSLRPGTVAILLAGRHRGKRVVVLKQLPSGLLLVCGPYKLNGVPLRRVNQAYVIATSTSVDVSKVDVSKIDDAYFPKATQKKATAESDAFFSAESRARRAQGEFQKQPAPTQARKDETKRVSSSLLAAIKSTPNLDKYLKSRFTLTRGQKPHQMKF